MRKVPYTYCLVKYVHNPAVGEMLNVGVLLCAPTMSFVAAKFNHYYERLSKTFAGFDGDHYREIIGNFENAVEKLQRRHDSPTLFIIEPNLENVDDVIKRVMPDRGLSIQFGGMLAGLAEDIEDELAHIFYQAVISQYPTPYKRNRDDDDVWQVYKKPLFEKRIDKYLDPKTFVSESYEYKFEHAFKNEKWHVLKPVNMDYAQSQSMQDRATRVLGEATALQENHELSTYYILLGEPRLDSHKASYIKAKNLLSKIPAHKEIIEEDSADHFADYLADYMRMHGLSTES